MTGEFSFRNQQMYCEGVALDRIAREQGTPVFVYSRKVLIERFQELKQAFKPAQPLICYSVKANSNLSLCKTLAGEGAGMDIVSGGELFRAGKAGVPGDKIVYASVGKTEEEIDSAVKKGILFFNAESVPELDLINKVCGRLKKRQAVALRVNPDVEAHTHEYITTARKQNKFGLDPKTVRKVFREAGRFEHLDLTCLHMHIGSQIEKVKPFVQALERVTALAEELNATGARITHLNIGGGLGIVYDKEKPQSAKLYAQAVLAILKGKNFKLILEPGRFIAGNAGVLLTRVVYVKNTPVKRFFVVDAAMNDLLRPSLYAAFHAVVPVRKRQGRLKKADVVGPVCESGDFIAKDRPLPGSLGTGELLAVMSTGAYGFSMSSNYNSRRRAAEVLVNGSKYAVIRKREGYADLIRNEVIVTDKEWL